jgi:hypothetical protein
MGITAGPSIIDDGLVIILDANDKNSYPGTGNVWYDLSGNDNHATLVNSPIWDSSGYFTFDGVNDYASINFQSSSMSDWANQQTITIWTYHNFTTSRRNIWNQSYGGYGTWTHESGENINGYYGDAGFDNPPYTSLNSGTTTRSVWNMLTMTRNTTNAYWYQNGTLFNSMSHGYGTLTTTTNNITIGYGYTGVYWQGNIRLIQCYNRLLTPSEISYNYNTARKRFNL